MGRRLIAQSPPRGTMGRHVVRSFGGFIALRDQQKNDAIR